MHARPVKPPMKKPPVKMGRKPATPPEILDHALNDLPIIEASIAAEDVQMLKKALYLIEAYRKFLQYLKMRYQESRWWARATASPVCGFDSSACDVSVGRTLGIHALQVTPDDCRPTSERCVASAGTCSTTPRPRGTTQSMPW